MRPVYPELTERQKVAWPEAIAEAQQYVTTSTISERIADYDWQVRFQEESRPGRGHDFTALWCDGEYIVSIVMDVYGSHSVGVGECDWIHNSAAEECDCDPCTAMREEED